jgi:hypothetical protein
MPLLNLIKASNKTIFLTFTLLLVLLENFIIEKFMSRLIKIFQKLNFVDSSIQDSDTSPSIPVFVSNHGPFYSEVPSGTVFITSRLILIPFPKEELIRSLSGYFNTVYSRKYMVWNLSENLYETDIFSGQVLDFVFVGYPNPPLGELFAIFNSVSGWLDSDPDNVAVFHCQATRARSYMLVASYLAWQNRKDPLQVFQEIAGKNGPLLFPSQIRYMSYVGQVINGAKVSAI